MKEQFVSFEMALKLKKLGFVENCFAKYDENACFYYLSGFWGFPLEEETDILAPLWQQVLEWLREIFQIDIIIESSGKSNIKSYIIPPFFLFEHVLQLLQHVL